jgi:mannose/fructose/N-acetylgalactosamine-specific phosphotransferase system component IIC
MLGRLVTSAGIRLSGEIAFGVGFAVFKDIPIDGTVRIFFFIGFWSSSR